MRKKKTGKCSICGKEAELSADHIPPKSCGNNSDTYYIQYTPEFLGANANRKLLHSQNGLTFTHICHECNNTMGSKYDIHLQEFRNFVLSHIDKTPYNGMFSLENVCKSVVGHFLAASNFDSCTFSKSMRNYYLNDDKTIYKDYSLMCAYYPYENCIFSLNDYVVMSLCDDNIPNGMISSLYFYPFAFIFCQKQRDIIGTDLFEICRNKCLTLKISADDWKGKAPSWPAIVDEEHTIFIGATMNDSKYKVK